MRLRFLPQCAGTLSPLSATGKLTYSANVMESERLLSSISVTASERLWRWLGVDSGLRLQAAKSRRLFGQINSAKDGRASLLLKLHR